MENNASDNRQALISGQQSNASGFGSKFKVIRFYLDTAKNRYTFGSTDHTFGSGIKSFWVCKTNNEAFIATIVPNYKIDRKENSGLPLRSNMNQKFTFPVDDACIEYAAQAGTWIDIAFSESEDISIGNTAVTLSGSVVVSEGSSTTQSKATVTTAIAELIPANDARTIARLQFKSGTGNVYVGTPANLADADYQNICHKILAGSDFEYKRTGAVSARTDASSTVFSLNEGIE